MSEGRVEAIAAAICIHSTNFPPEEYPCKQHIRTARDAIAADDKWLAEHPDEAPWLKATGWCVVSDTASTGKLEYVGRGPRPAGRTETVWRVVKG